MSPARLDWSDEEIRRACEAFSETLRDYLAGLPERPVFPVLDRGALERIAREEPPESGTGFAEVLSRFREAVVPNATAIPSPRFLGYINCTPTVTAILAESLAAMLNQNCTIWKLSPSANAVELAVLGWFKRLFGFGEEAHGILTSGGSVANLVGLAAARQRHLPVDAREEGLQAAPVSSAPLTVYASDETHNSIDKALVLLGIGGRHLRKVPADATFRIDLKALEARVEADRVAGFTPFCVVGNAGTIATAAIDPLDALADFCARHDMWLHVDGAFGAFGALVEEIRRQMTGVERADSFSLDPHKLLFVPMEAGGVLVRDRALLRRTFSFIPSYYTVIDDPLLCDFTEYGPQLSRSFRALKVWMSLLVHGLETYRGLIARTIGLAHHAEAAVGDTPELEMAAPVSMMVACFRYVGGAGSPLRADPALADRCNERLLDTLVDSGRAFISRARLKGRFALRICVVNYRTTRQDVEDVLAEVVRIGRRLENGPESA
jgi:glutamate/tyrosine decarboxylase-like PLP-dependent enzyme